MSIKNESFKISNDQDLQISILNGLTVINNLIKQI